MPTVYTPQNIKHATVSVAHGNEKRIWDNSNGQASTAYVRTLVENIADNAEHAEQVAISAVAIVDAMEVAVVSAVATVESFEGRLASLEETLTGTLEIAPRDLSFVLTDDPQASWVNYDADDYLADQLELANQTRVAYKQFLLPPDCYGTVNMRLFSAKISGTDGTNIVRCSLHQRVADTINPAKRIWEPWGVVSNESINSSGDTVYYSSHTTGVVMTAEECTVDKCMRILVELINCPVGKGTFGGVRLEYTSTAKPNNTSE